MPGFNAITTQTAARATRTASDHHIAVYCPAAVNPTTSAVVIR